MMDTHK